MYESKAMDTPSRPDADGSGSSRAVKTLVTIFALIGLVLLLTWAVSVFFGIALVKSLAAVILMLFLIGVALLVAGVA